MVKSYEKNYPRPQFSRGTDSWQTLNGRWDFAFDQEQIGEVQGWQAGFSKTHDITVPFTYETKQSGIGKEEECPAVWYARTIQQELSVIENSQLLLHFEGSDYKTKLWVNGQFIGQHIGGYNRFTFDITPALTNGENLLVVKVEDRLDPHIPRGKQRWTDHNFGCWYVQTTGIWKTVWTEIRPNEYIDSVKMTPHTTTQELELAWDIHAENYSPNLMLEATITFQDTFINRITLPVTSRFGGARLSVTNYEVSEWGLRSWGPGHPDLYDIEFRLLQDTTPIDRVLSYFGMRNIHIDGSQVIFNGSPLYQRLLLDQGYWEESHLTPPNEEAIITDIDRTLDFGFNGIRKHQKIEDPLFLFWCDVKGMLVWSEMAAAYAFNDYAIEEFTNQWMKIVKQHYNHPSIITWVPFNESWGVSQIKTCKKQQQFADSIYHLTKAFDSTRPVVSNDGWEHATTDIVTLHDYASYGEALTERYYYHLDDVLSGDLYHNLSKSAFAEGYEYTGQPIILSEYGGIAFDDGEEGWGYGDKVRNKADYIERYESLTIAIKENPHLVGFCYTQTTDVQQEINGLMDPQRNPKIDPQIIREINTRDVSEIHRP